MKDLTRWKKVYPIVSQEPRFVPANNFFSGEVEPPASLGFPGDFYLKFQGPAAPPPSNNSVLLYGPKSSLGWGTAIELVGDIGPEGPPGTDGLQGDSGLDGKTILSGASDPTSDVGSDGDFYLNIYSKTFFGPKSAGIWPSGFSMIGPTGEQGAQGEIGPAGPAGESGPAGPAGPSYDGKTGNTIWVTKQSGGAYTSLQDAIDQSVAGDTILVGAGSWGEITLKPGINLIGLQPRLGDKVVISKITFVSQINTVAATNTVFLSNLRVSNSENASLIDIKPDFFLPPGDPENPTEIQPIYGGPFRITFSGCRLYRNNSVSTQPLIKLSSAGGDTDSSVYFDDCVFAPESGQNSANLVQSSVRYLDLNNCKLWGGSKSLRILGGSVAASNCRFESSYSGPLISLEALGTGLTLGESLVRNLGGVSSKGVSLVAGSICAVSNTVFDISFNSGTACIEGPAGAVCYYGNITSVTPQPNPSTGQLTEQRSTNIAGDLTKIPFTQVS